MSDPHRNSARTPEAPANQKQPRLAAWLRQALKPEDCEHLLEMLTAILLSSTTILSASCAYQTIRWSGV